jgi:integrase/recombinase XerC/integrase/recombinase XerD
LLTDLSNAGASAHTLRGYRGDLIAFAAHHDGEIGELTAAPVRVYLSEIAGAGGRQPRALGVGARWSGVLERDGG